MHAGRHTCIQAHEPLAHSTARAYTYKQIQTHAQMHTVTSANADERAHTANHARAWEGHSNTRGTHQVSTPSFEHLYESHTHVVTSMHTHIHACSPCMQSLTHTHSDTCTNTHTQPYHAYRHTPTLPCAYSNPCWKNPHSELLLMSSGPPPPNHTGHHGFRRTLSAFSSCSVPPLPSLSLSVSPLPFPPLSSLPPFSLCLSVSHSVFEENICCLAKVFLALNLIGIEIC